MTLVEYLAPLGKATNRMRLLAVIYFSKRYDGVDALTLDEIRSSLKRARVKGARDLNVADILAKSGHLVDTPGTQGIRRLWRLTASGEEEVRAVLQLPPTHPEVEHDV